MGTKLITLSAATFLACGVAFAQDPDPENLSNFARCSDCDPYALEDSQVSDLIETIARTKLEKLGYTSGTVTISNDDANATWLYFIEGGELGLVKLVTPRPPAPAMASDESGDTEGEANSEEL